MLCACFPGYRWGEQMLQSLPDSVEFVEYNRLKGTTKGGIPPLIVSV